MLNIDEMLNAAFQVSEPAFQAVGTFDWVGAFYAHLGFLAGGHHFILAADSLLHWSQASRLLDSKKIEHKGHPLASGDCLFIVSEDDSDRAEKLLEKYGGRVFHCPLDDLLFFV